MGRRVQAARRPYATGATTGVVYAIGLRTAIALDATGAVFTIMSVGFVFLVPLVMGILTLRPVPHPRWTTRVFAPWGPTAVCMLLAGIIGFEGLICIVMALPAWLAMASLGGLCEAWLRLTPRGAVVPVVVAPLLLAAIERQMPPPPTVREVRTSIAIAAPPAVVWSHVVRVPAIDPRELPWSWVYAIGFPRPIEATLSHAGVGGVRHASFERGVVFVETIDTWEDERRLAFHFDIDPATIPPTTLDEHVTVGGPYFDVLEGRYELEPLPDGRVVLHLSSRHRLSTDFNFYAAFWTDAVMRGVQETILVVLKARAEAGVPR